MITLHYSFIIGHYMIFGLIINISHQVPLVGEYVRNAEINEFPTVVAIEWRRASEMFYPFCTGILISNRHVLTAAHCLVNVTANEIRLKVKSINLKRGGKHAARHWMTYREWKYRRSNFTCDTLLHDVAIITLKSRVQNVPPVMLSNLTLNQLAGTEVKVAGWGMTNDNVRPHILRTGRLKVISNNDCNDYLRLTTNRLISIHENNFCSKAIPWILTGCGDSGGPSFDNDNRLVGLTIGSCPEYSHFVVPPWVLEMYQLVVHINVNYYRDFIEAFKTI